MSDTTLSSPIAELRGVRVAQEVPFDCALAADSFRIDAGEFAFVTIPHDIHRPPLADIMTGLVAPVEGVASFGGSDWRSLSPNEANRARARIGRVLSGTGSAWLSNLDMDENLTLALRFHQGELTSEIHARIEETAKTAGCWPLPEGRASAVPRGTLRRIEWVRAFIHEPSLVILERPLRDIAGDSSGLAKLIEHARNRGAGILWMARAGDPWHDAAHVSSRWKLADGKLEASQ